MFGLQELFEKTIMEFTAPKEVFLRLINRRFQELGLSLTTAQQDILAEAILRIEEDAIHLVFENDQISNAGFGNGEELKHLIQKIFDGLPEDLDKFVTNFEEKIPETLKNLISEVVPLVIHSLKDQAPEMLVKRRKAQKKFTKNLANPWGEAIDLLEMFLVIGFESGEYVNKIYRPKAKIENDLVFDVLTRLHSRSCQISEEILTLLGNGFADGAHARWRSLHEVAVVANFIAQGNNELAERYLLHENIESYKAAIQYRAYSQQLDLEEIRDQEIDELARIREQLMRRFGREYGNDYGWASETLGKSRPTFRDIESAVNLDHLRPYYRLASYNIHANPKGVFFKLGILNDTNEFLLAGPSNLGLTEPGHLMALSLGHVTTVLLTHNPTVDTLVIANMLLLLGKEVGDALYAAHNAIIDRI